MTGHDRFDRLMSGLGWVAVAAFAVAYIHQGYISYGDQVVNAIATMVQLLP
jgi:hypothetical protein